MSGPIDVVVVGAGAIGRTHIDTVRRSRRFRLAAIVDGAPAARELAASLDVPHFADINGGLGGAAAAIVATPNETHLPISAALLGRGIPVLLEKPVAEGLGAALELIGVAERTGLPVLVGHHRRHNPIILAAKRAIDDGRLGDLVFASVTCSLAKTADYFSADWRRTPGAGGPLLINLVHEIDLLRFFFGEIAEVQAIVSNRRRGFAVEDTAVVNLAFAAGGLASLSISDAATGPWAWDLTAGENPARFPAHPVAAHHYAGSKGGLSLPDLTLWLPDGEPDWTKTLRPERPNFVAGDPYVAQLDHFADLVAGVERQPRVSLRDATANLIVVDAIRDAARTGRSTAVDLSSLAGQSGQARSTGASA